MIPVVDEITRRAGAGKPMDASTGSFLDPNAHQAIVEKRPRVSRVPQPFAEQGAEANQNGGKFHWGNFPKDLGFQEVFSND